MSTLQLWLAVLGGLVLAGVIAHGAWQARRSGVRHADPRPAPARPTRGEPQFDDADTAPAVLVSSGDEDPDGMMEASVPRGEADIPMAVPAARRMPQRIDALIDAIVPLRLESPVSAESVLQHFPLTRRAGGKPFLIEGLDAESGTWEVITPNHTYGELQAGVQLANRLGPLNEIEYSEFVQKVQAFSEGIGALPDFPDMLEVVGRARELDGFACAHDAQLAMRLRARHSAWSVAYVQQQAAQQGFMPGGVPGRLVMPGRDEGAPPLLTLQFDAQAAFAEEPNQTAIRELVLALDVPQSGAEERPYDHWCRVGLALAVSLDATLFDDSGLDLNPDSLPAVGEELHKLYVAMVERDLAAGSPAARRLFS